MSLLTQSSATFPVAKIGHTGFVDYLLLLLTAVFSKKTLISAFNSYESDGPKWNEENSRPKRYPRFNEGPVDCVIGQDFTRPSLVGFDVHKQGDEGHCHAIDNQ